MLPPIEATSPLYSKIVDISGKNEIHKERRIKTQNKYYVGLYMLLEVVIIEEQEEGSNVEETKTRGGGGVASPS